jgi:hypothetical protein
MYYEQIGYFRLTAADGCVPRSHRPSRRLNPARISMQGKIQVGPSIRIPKVLVQPLYLPWSNLLSKYEYDTGTPPTIVGAGTELTVLDNRAVRIFHTMHSRIRRLAVAVRGGVCFVAARSHGCVGGLPVFPPMLGLDALG